MPRHLAITVREIPMVPAPPRGWLARAWDTLRSYTIPPLSMQSPEIQRLFGGDPTSAGVPMNAELALTIAAVWDAVQTIAGDIASLPLHLYKRIENGGKERMTWSKVYRLLHDEPNPEMTAMVFRETLQGHVLLHGNAYAEIERSFNGEPVALWPLTPERVTPERTRRTDELFYRVRNKNGGEDTVAPADMLHIPGLGYDGTVGYSVIAKARESFALTKAVEKFGATFFSKGARSGGVMQHPGKLSPEAHARLKKSLADLQEHEYAILEEGMTLEKWTIPPDDAQFLTSRTFQVGEIARWFGIPPHKLGELSHATFSNIEQQEIEYVSKTLRRWLVRWEQEINRKLIRPLERSQQFAEHMIDGLLRGDIGSRYNAYAVGRQWGWLSADDVREKENMNPLPEGQGKVYLLPGNMLPANKADEIQPPGPRPAAPAATTDDEDDARVVEALLATLRVDMDKKQEALLRAMADGQEAIAEVIRASIAADQAEKADLEARQASQTTVTVTTDAPQPAPPTVEGMAEIVAEVRAGNAALVAQMTAMAEEWTKVREGAAKTAERMGGRLRDLHVDQAQREQLRRAHAEMLPGLRLTAQDAMRRMLHREGGQLRRAAQTPEKLRAWADAFYVRRQPMLDTVVPVLTILAGLKPGEPPTIRAERLVAEHCERSRREIGELLEKKPSDLVAAVETLAARWEADRPAEVAHALIQEVMGHE